MCKDDKETAIEILDSDDPIEIYTDERIAEFLAEDKLTAEQKERLAKKLKQPNRTER